MEEKKYLKISKGMLVCVIIIVLLVMIIIGFGIYVYFLKSDKVETSEPISNVQNEQMSQSIKIDNTKDYVYEKDRTEINEKVYESTYTDTIKLPFVNINSEDAQKINETVEQQYKKASTSLKWDEYSFEYTQMKYEFNLLDERMLSLKVETNDARAFSGGFLGKDYVYNIDLESGKQLSKQQMLEELNITNMDERIENEVTKRLLEEYGSYFGFETLEDVYEICDLENYEIFVKDENNLEIYFPYDMTPISTEPLSIAVNMKI